MSSDGSRLREAWSTALKNAQSRFSALLVSSTSPSWKQVRRSREPLPVLRQEPDPPPRLKGKAKLRSSQPEFSDVIVHRKSSKDGDVLRAVLDIDVDESVAGIDSWNAVLATPEMRKEYDPCVQDGRIIELFDPETQIQKTDFAFGWPASPRDAITISRSFTDATTLIHISTSLPRSSDEPSYLRPAPPFVRSHVHLYAWCIQYIQPPSESSSKRSPHKMRITCLWEHDLNAMWGMRNSVSQNLPTMLVGLVKVVRNHGNRMALMTGYGHGVGISHLDFQVPRQLLTLSYSVTSEVEDGTSQAHGNVDGMDDLRVLREQRRLDRSIEVRLPSSHSWDVQLHTRTLSTAFSGPHWIVHASHGSSSGESSPSPSSAPPIIFRISHPRPPENTVLKVTVAIEPAVGSQALRVNGTRQVIHAIESRDPSFSISKQMLQDASTISEISVVSSSSSIMGTVQSSRSSPSKRPRPESGGLGVLPNGGALRSPAVKKAILTLVRRNYIYFTSLLQEPEAKWSKAITEARGVTVTQLNSIDPTLVVYRAEAVFVGVGVWDLLSTITTPGVGGFWNKGHEDALFLEHVNELTELWHFKTRAAWPVNARDSVQVRTTYKAPTACHVFSFSTDDITLFPSIPSPEPGTIRSQIDLQGWAIEALSPNTTLLTLLDQSDPKGWSNKSSIPSQMIAAVAGVGEFAIKYGGPPITTRISGAKCVNSRYDHERNVFRLDYVPNSAPSPPSSTALTPTKPLSEESTPVAANFDLPALPDDDSASTSIESASSTSSHQSTLVSSTIECELRCDIDTWASSIDLIVDPAPQIVSCLRRHKLATGGGGLWLTIEHDASQIVEDRLTVVVRKGSGGKDKGTVVVNGAKVKVDVEDLPEHEVKSLARMKRVKPARIPLDQPPVLTALRRRGAEYDTESDAQRSKSRGTTTLWRANRPNFVTSFGNLFSSTVEQVIASNVTTTNGRSPSLPTTQTSGEPASILPQTRPPMHYAFDALSRVREMRDQSISDGWTLVSEREIPVYKKIVPSISPTIAIHKGQKVIEGFGAEEIAAAISDNAVRIKWDDRIDSVLPLDQFGSGCHTSFVVKKAGFPFRDRGFYVASLVARLLPDIPASNDEDGHVRSRSISITSSGTNLSLTPTLRPTSMVCVSVSCSTTLPPIYSQRRVNPFVLPVGRILIEGWILETLNPYTSENLAIPSTRCTMISAMDLAGSVPNGYNASVNASLPRSILALEKYLHGKITSPYSKLPAPSIAFKDSDDVEDHRSKDVPWTLHHVDPERTLVSSSYEPTDKSFRMTVLLRPKGAEPEESPALPPFQANCQPPTPMRQTTLEVDSTSSGPYQPDSRSTPPFRSRPQSLSAPPSGLRVSFSGQVEDSVLCEVVIDPALYPKGYSVKCGSKLSESCDYDATHKGIDFPPIPLDPAVYSGIPILFSIHPIPAASLASTSVSSPTSRHLLRITIPTAQFFKSDIEDPLTGTVTQPPLKPDWLLQLEQYGGLLDMVIQPLDDEKHAITVNGTKIKVSSDRPPLPSLGRGATESEGIEILPLLKREVSPESTNSAAERPVASSCHLFDEAAAAAAKVQNPLVKEVPALDEPQLDTTPAETPPGAATPAIEPPSGILSFFNAYSTPVLRRSSLGNEAPPPSYWPPKGSLSIPSRWLTRRTSDEPAAESSAPPPLKETSNGVPTDEATAIISRPSPVAHRTFTLHSVLVIALIAFLLGSLLRSLLSPNDFIMLHDRQKGDPAREWHEVKRLLQIRVLGQGLLVAFIRR